MPIISAADAVRFTLPGIEFTGLAAPSRGASESSVWFVRIAPGTAGTPHRLTREEVIVAIEGKARATLGEQSHDLEAGGAIVVPAGADFSLENPYDVPFRAIAVLPVGGQAIVGPETFTPPWAQ